MLLQDILRVGKLIYKYMYSVGEWQIQHKVKAQNEHALLTLFTDVLSGVILDFCHLWIAYIPCCICQPLCCTVFSIQHTQSIMEIQQLYSFALINQPTQKNRLYMHANYSYKEQHKNAYHDYKLNCKLVTICTTVAKTYAHQIAFDMVEEIKWNPSNI